MYGIFLPDKPAEMSSTYRSSSSASNAVNGLYLPSANLPDVKQLTHSENQANPWLRVDLLAEHFIISVVILNRESKL